jgi:hypothetical protein
MCGYVQCLGMIISDNLPFLARAKNGQISILIKILFKRL